MINILRALIKKIENTQEQVDNVRKMEIVRRNEKRKARDKKHCNRIPWIGS